MGILKDVLAGREITLGRDLGQRLIHRIRRTRHDDVGIIFVGNFGRPHHTPRYAAFSNPITRFP